MLRIAQAAALITAVGLMAQPAVAQEPVVDSIQNFDCGGLAGLQTLETKDDPTADYTLSKLYYSGHCVPKNQEAAAALARRSAEQGNSKAQGFLAIMLKYGWGISQDDVEAVKWAKRSAEQGEVSGQMILGSLYQDGRGGLQRDRITAEKWYILAEKNGVSGGALAAVQEVNESFMTAADISEAHRRADAFKTAPESSPSRK